MKKLIQLTASLMLVFFLFITCSKDDDTVVQYSLSVEVTPMEGGSVSPSSGKYDEDEIITLLATPSPEYIFKNWSGGASGTSNPTTTIMNSDKSVTAVFEKRQYPLAIEIEGQGTVTEELLSSKPAGNFPSGSSVRLTAVPVNGWEFVQWSGDQTGVVNPVTISIDKPKNIKVKFQPVLYNQIIGKWDVNNLSSKPSSKKNSSKKAAPISVKITDGECIVYSLVFNSDGSFVLSLSSGEINGTFYFDSANSIVLNNHGKVDNIHINNNVLNFHLNLNNLCSSDETAEDDEDYVEGECVSFLNCNDGNVWLLQTSEGQKYIRVTNDLGNVWIEHYTFDKNRQCTIKSMTNKTNDYNVILLENDIAQMTYVLDNTPDGDVSVILSITADNHLSVKYDYINNALDETDYYVVSSVDSLNEYLNSYSECPQLTYVPDDNFEQALIDLGYDDVLDDYVLTANINEILELSVSEESIADLTGIEDFLGLKRLYLYTSSLESIDLTSNTALTLILLDNNNLTSIDLSENTALTFLALFNNQLTNIDLSKNTALTSLQVSNNQLTSIDLSTNTALTYLDLSSNQLTSIDLSTNTALTILGLRFNQLTSIDVSKNKALTSLDLVDNKLTSIDVSAITNLTGLILSNNQLTSLDLSNNTALVSLRLHNNQLTSIDLSANTALTSLALGNNPNLSCIQVNQTQLNAIPSTWYKDAGASYSLDCSNPNAGKTYVPDDNFEQYLIDLGYDDILDDYVLTSNIVGVELLDLSQARNITNTWGDWQLTGIEDFLGLKTLTLFANHYNIDTFNFNTNTQLETLIIYEGNSLTSVDLSNNPKLKVLRIDGGFQNTLLDVSKNIHLESLTLLQTQLISLDVSNNTVLTTLDLRYNNSLTCIQVNQNQLNAIPTGWSNDSGATWSINCN